MPQQNCETFLMNMETALSSLWDTEWQNTFQVCVCLWSVCVFKWLRFHLHYSAMHLKSNFCSTILSSFFVPWILLTLSIMSQNETIISQKQIKRNFSREDIPDLSQNRIDSTFILWSLYLIHSLIIKFCHYSIICFFLYL